jgi:GNAT superfamily N-acetyltransferase
MPAMEVVVRPARAGDGADLARGWTDAGRYYAELDPDAFQVPAADGLSGWLEELLRRPRSSDQLWLVAEVDGRVVGDVHAHLERPAKDAARQLLRDLGRVRVFVDALGVEERYRRLGIGTRLMQEAERWARANGAVRAVLTTYVDSPLSVPFYERRLAYQRRSIVFEKPLD